MGESGTHVDSIEYGFVPDKRAGMMKYSRRRGNVMCNVSSVFILIERKWARNQEGELHEQVQAKDAFPLRQSTNNKYKALTHPYTLPQVDA